MVPEGNTEKIQPRPLRSSTAARRENDLSSDQPLAHQTLAQPSTQPPIAPAWHTILFVGIVVVFAAMSAHSQQQMVARHGRVVMYVMTIVWEWLLLAYIVWGARRSGVGLREIVGGRWASPEDALLDLAIAVGFWIAAAVLLAALSFALGLTHADQLQQARKQLGELLPRSRTELGLWLGLSATAGFCEEIMFRGYLQKQFTAATRSAWMGLLLQAVVFGIAHAYQGGRRILLIGCYGAMFGGLALWRKSLRPGMMAHALQDSLSGVLFRFMK